jgi:hypothetical protein
MEVHPTSKAQRRGLDDFQEGGENGKDKIILRFEAGRYSNIKSNKKTKKGW